jgi:chorismate dehydratase
MVSGKYTLQIKELVALCKILAVKAWKREFEWFAIFDFEITSVKHGEAAVMIGISVLSMHASFPSELDLGMEWKKFTGLPFVFACWVSSNLCLIILSLSSTKLSATD